MKYLLKNGTVISGAGTRKQDVLVEGEKIIKVGEDLSQPDAKVVDAVSYTHLRDRIPSCFCFRYLQYQYVRRNR